MDGLPLTPQDTDLRHILCPIFVRSRLVGSCGPPGTVRFHPTPSHYGMCRLVSFRLSPILILPCVIVALPDSAVRERKPPTSGETAFECLYGEGSPATVDDRVSHRSGRMAAGPLILGPFSPFPLRSSTSAWSRAVHPAGPKCARVPSEGGRGGRIIRPGIGCNNEGLGGIFVECRLRLSRRREGLVVEY